MNSTSSAGWPRHANKQLEIHKGLQAPVLRLSLAFLIFAATLFSAGQAGAQTTTGDAALGGTTFAANCNGCHSSATSSYPAIQNGANAGRIIEEATIGGMNGYTNSSFSSTTENNLAAYIAQSRMGSIATQSVVHNVNKTITITNMRFNSAYSQLNTLAIGGTRARGVVTTTTTTAAGEPQVIYNPNNGECGTDSFTVQGISSITFRSTNVRTINVSIANPAAPVISSGSTGSANFNTFTSNAYTTTTTGGAPLSYTATGLPPGLSISASGVVSGTPTAAGTYNATISARNCFNGNLAGQQDSQAVTFTISKDSQTITFNAQTTGSRVFSPGGTFTISPTATASSGLAVTYASGNTAVCTVSGTTVTMVGVGTCPIQAQQTGDGNYNAATPVTQNVSITQASQSITFGAQTTPRNFVSIGSSFVISPTASATSGLAIAYSSGNTAVCTVSGTTVFMQSAGTCPIRANQSGNTNYAAATQVTQNVAINAIAPTAPQTPGGSVGDGQVNVTFSAPSNTGGSAISSYFASCSPSGSGTSSTSPITVSGLSNGVTYACSVRATNAAGLTGSFSSSVNLTPQATPVAPVFTSPASESFTLGVSGSHQVAASGIPTPSLSLTSGSLPSGISFIPGSGLLGGKAGSGTAGNYPLTFTASNSAGTVNQNFTLTIKKQIQTITFPQVSDTMVDGTTVTLGATSDSGLAASYSIAPASASICSVAGNLVTKLAAGNCQVLADQAGNEDYSPANQVAMTFAIALGSQTITFPSQSTPTQPFSGATTFGLNPVATASSGLAVSYASLTPAVCTVAATTVTKVDVGLCTIQATQAGNAAYSAASPVSVDIQIVQGTQTITFAVSQAAQAFVSGGTFALSPVGTASSGLTVSYSSTTTAVCTVSGTTVTMVSAGSCIVAANQAGNTRYAAAPQVTRTITINPALAGAPTLTEITAAPGQVTLQFDPPAQTGGSVITGYSAQCNPGAVSNTSATSPIVISGLTNGVTYTCSVSAINAAGTGPASNTLQATPQAASGASIWNSVCTACHSQVPSGIQLNGAGLTSTVLQHVRSNVTTMINTPSVQALSAGDLALVAAYINDNVPNIVVTTTPNTPKTISVASHVTFTGSVAFNAVEVVTPPSNGSLGSWFAGGRSITYTPTNGFTGNDSFTYRPKHTVSGLTGDPRTVTIQVTSSTVTLSVTGAGTGEGIINSTPFGIWSCYQSAGEFAGGVCSSSFPTGTTVTLNAAPVTGSEFSAWSGVSCAGGNSTAACILTLNSGMAAVASFAPAVNAIISPQDLNDDSKSDLIWQNLGDGSVQGWLMNGTSATQLAGLLPAGGYTITHIADLDGNGKTDTLISHTDGTTIGWLHDGLSVVGQATFFSAGSGWSIKHAADMDGDQKADLIVQHTDGTVVGWLMNGLTVTSAATFVPAGSGWSVSRVGDLNGDGRVDLIWQHSSGTVQAWLMNGLGVIETATFVGAGSGWSVKLVADLNGDGKADLVWQNADGTVQAWLMNGTAVTQIASFVPAGTGWSPVLAGDINGDGKADLFWQHTDGRSQTWLMDGLTVSALAGFVGAGAWSATHLLDLNGDGKRDILWRNADGSVQAWLMDGLTITQIASLAGAGSYVVIPARP